MIEFVLKMFFRPVLVLLGGLGWWVLWWFSVLASWMWFPADPSLFVYKVALVVSGASVAEGAGVSSRIVPWTTALLHLVLCGLDDLA